MKDFIVKQLVKWLAPSTIKRLAASAALLVGGWLAAVIPSELDAGDAITKLTEGIEGIVIILASIAIAAFTGKKKV